MMQSQEHAFLRPLPCPFPVELDLPSRKMLPPFDFPQDQLCCESTGFWNSSAQTGLGLTAIGSGVLSDKVPSGIWGVFFPVSSACDHTFPNMDRSSFTASSCVSVSMDYTERGAVECV